jgi:hypothetical protein
VAYLGIHIEKYRIKLYEFLGFPCSSGTRSSIREAKKRAESEILQAFSGLNPDSPRV